MSNRPARGNRPQPGAGSKSGGSGGGGSSALLAGLAGYLGQGAAPTATGASVADPEAVVGNNPAYNPNIAATQMPYGGAQTNAVTVKPPGFWSNFATRGQAGLNYNQFLYGQQLQNQLGQQNILQEQTRGGEERKTKVTEGEQARITSENAAHIKAMQDAGLDPTDKNDSNLFYGALQQQRANIAAQNAVTMENQANNLAKISGSPNAFAATQAGYLAKQAGPYLEAQSKAPMTGPLENRYLDFGGAMAPFNMQGVTPKGTFNAETTYGPDNKPLTRKVNQTGTEYNPSFGRGQPTAILKANQNDVFQFGQQDQQQQNSNPNDLFPGLNQPQPTGISVKPQLSQANPMGNSIFDANNKVLPQYMQPPALPAQQQQSPINLDVLMKILNQIKSQNPSGASGY